MLFCTEAGTAYDRANLRRVFKKAAATAAVPWASFHTLRHTCATLLFESGKNVKQVQAWLGHHSASFTLDVYIHLMPDGWGAPDVFEGLGVAVDAPTSDSVTSVSAAI